MSRSFGILFREVRTSTPDPMRPGKMLTQERAAEMIVLDLFLAFLSGAGVLRGVFVYGHRCAGGARAEGIDRGRQIMRAIGSAA